METYIGEIRFFGFDYAPRGWAPCDGAILRIADNPALYSLLGAQFGGDGTTTFALPDLRAAVPTHQGTAPDLPERAFGARFRLSPGADPGVAPGAAPAPARTIGTLMLNPCICVEGTYPSRP